MGINKIIIASLICWGIYFSQYVFAQGTFKQIPLQYIVALDNPQAKAGDGAQHWGIWRQDPGPRGCLLDNFKNLKETGVAPAQWAYDAQDWWLEEHGAVMEKPSFPVPAGRYVVTGGRQKTAVLLIYPPDAHGNSHWELNNDATLNDVTHLPCHAARYRPKSPGVNCSPEAVNKLMFPITAGVAMPTVDGCHQQEYAVLFVIGLESN